MGDSATASESFYNKRAVVSKLVNRAEQVVGFHFGVRVGRFLYGLLVMTAAV